MRTNTSSAAKRLAMAPGGGMTVLWELCKPHELSVDQSNGDALLANCAFIAILTALLMRYPTRYCCQFVLARF